MFGRNPTGGPLPQSLVRDQECFPGEATVRKRSLMAGSCYRLGAPPCRGSHAGKLGKAVNMAVSGARSGLRHPGMAMVDSASEFGGL